MLIALAHAFRIRMCGNTYLSDVWLIGSEVASFKLSGCSAKSLLPLQLVMVCRKPLEAREVAIIRRMKRVLKLPITKIASVLDRNKTSIYKALEKGWKQSKRGRPAALTRMDVTHLVRTLKAMQQKAKAMQEITLAMLKKRAKCKVSGRCIREAFKKRNIKFRKMRSKPLLTKADQRARFKFAQHFRLKSTAWWQKNIHLHIDVKNFPAYIHAQARDIAAMRTVRGAYRQLGQGLDEAYVVLPKELRYNPGAKSVKVLAGVAVGRVRMWHVLEQKWSGRAAAAVYAGPVINALQRTWPGKRVFHVLEDNDPTGFKSGRGEAAKKTAGIKAFVIPKRSPDLNVCDYALWSAVNRKMRRQELSFPRAKREARSEYVLRLRRAAQSLSRSFVERSIGDMKRRCQLLYARRGGLFEEGGRRCMS